MSVCHLCNLGIMEPIATGKAAQDYLAKAVNPTLLKGLTELCKNKPADPVVSQPSLYCIVLSFYWKQTLLTERNNWNRLVL